MSPVCCPLRLIEDYSPIESVSVEAGRENSIIKGHISTLHLWWARRLCLPGPCGLVLVDSYWRRLPVAMGVCHNPRQEKSPCHHHGLSLTADRQ